jgi:hypothetical protein
MHRFIFLLLLLPIKILAQPTLTFEKNAPLPGNDIVKQQVKYVDPGRSGRMIIWNFSNLKVVNDSYIISHENLINQKGKEQLIATEHNTSYYYDNSSDTIRLNYQENPTSLIQYDIPEIQLIYPFTYGSKISNPFKGKGYYSRSLTFSVDGITNVVGDAYGMLITPNNDTLRKVLRVKTTRNYNDESNKHHISLEKYAWYMENYRYPIFEVIKTYTSELNKKDTDYSSCAFYYPPQKQHYSHFDSNSEVKEIASDEELLTYRNAYPNPCNGTLHVEYNVNRLSSVNVGIYNLQGVEMQKLVSNETQDRGNYVYSFNLGNYSSGIYLLKFEIENNSYIKRIVKK